MGTTSQTLLERVRSRDDREAWERFVALYSPLLADWVRQQDVTPPEVDDVVQEVFLLLLAKLPDFKYDPRQTFRGWLRTLAINKLREHRRKRSPALLEDPDEWGALSDDRAGDLLAETEYRQHLVARALELMQDHFNPSTWKACWETTVNSRTAADVGQELGMSEGAVWVAKSRVLRWLRQELDGLMD